MDQQMFKHAMSTLYISSVDITKNKDRVYGKRMLKLLTIVKARDRCNFVPCNLLSTECAQLTHALYIQVLYESFINTFSIQSIKYDERYWGAVS